MYYIFKAEIRGEYELNYAEVIGEMPNFLDISHEWSWWSDDPLPVQFPKTTFSIDETIYQDAYRTGAIFDLHSEKLASLIQSSGVKCEYFPVDIVGRKSNQRTLENFLAFHLMETHDVIDYSKSNLIEEEPVSDLLMKARIRKGNKFIGKKIMSMKISKEILSSQMKFLRDRQRPNLMFVHESLKDTFDESGIQGCQLTHYKNFRDITISDIFTND